MRALFISNRIKCSITVEASLIFPIVICILFLLLGPLSIIYTSSNIMILLDKQSKNISYYEMLKENIDSNDDKLELDKLNNTELNKEIEMTTDPNEKKNYILESIENLTNYGLIIYNLMRDYDNNNIFNNIRLIIPKKEDIFDDNTKMITEDIYVYFKLPLNLFFVEDICQRFVNERRAFVGIYGDRYQTIDIQRDLELVYIAYNHIYSNVYHIKKECTYLIKNVQRININNITNYKNDAGSNYDKCIYCYKHYNGSDVKDVYITKYGIYYHIKNNCPKMTAYTKAITKDEANELELRICEKCRKEADELSN